MSGIPAQISGWEGESSSRATAVTRPVGWPAVVFSVLCRALFGAFLLLTSAYCLLLYIPFTYFGFIHNPLLAWLPVFVQIHAYLFLGLVAAVAATLLPQLRWPETRRPMLGFVVVNGLIAVYLVLRPALPGMERDMFAYVWSMLCLFPLLWLAALDLRGSWQTFRRELPGSPLDLAAGAICGVVVGAAFAAAGYVRQFSSASGIDTNLRGLAFSMMVHAALFAAIVIILVGIRSFARASRWPRLTQVSLIAVFSWVICAEVLRRIILPTLSFEGLQANLYSCVVAAVMVIYGAGVVTVVRTNLARRTHESRSLPGWRFAFAGIALMAAAYAIPSLLGPTDWDFVLQKTAVLLTWAAALMFVRWAGVGFRSRRLRVLMACVLALAVLTLGVYRAAASRHPEIDSEWNGIMEGEAGMDVSFKTASDILARSIDNDAYAPLYHFLQHNTNLGPEVAIKPADTRLVADLKSSPGPHPNIFIFVIDSLRRDYVPPYNPAAAAYAPAMDQFARDSISLENAFTHYAGTALSEPAVWVGALQLHKQYIEPFYPMNNLQKMLDADGYRQYISVDPILEQILRPSPAIVRLDENTKLWSNLDFVSTLKELEGKIDARGDERSPIFAYTQPQNVHTLTLESSSHGGSRKEISIYEIRRMDAAFGEFVDFLKQRRLYDNSIIVITSDHGDSYGEFGRYGHADFLFPEVTRIPLIIHLPSDLRDNVVWDTKQIAFSTDITPSLYYLLGHRPIMHGDLLGKPLFTQSMAEQQSYLKPEYLIASSYAPVYGILKKNGTSLFIADAVNHKTYFYDLAKDPLGIHNEVTPEIVGKNEPLIRQDIGTIDRFYGYTSPAD